MKSDATQTRTKVQHAVAEGGGEMKSDATQTRTRVQQVVAEGIGET